MKRILIFSLAYYPAHVGGAEVAIKEITDRIDTQDIEFDMVCLRFDKNLPEVEKIGNVMVYRIGYTTDNPTMSDLQTLRHRFNKLRFQFSAVKKANELHSKKPYDALWAMMAHATGVPAGLFKARHPKVAYLLTLQEGDPIDHIKRTMLPLYPLFKRAFTKADSIQAISTYLAQWGKDMGFKGDVEVVPNAVDTTHFSQEYPAEELDALRKKLGKKEGEKYIITTSRLVYKNAIDDIITALTHLPKHISLLVLGIGPEQENLKRLAWSDGVEDRVIFLGHVDQKELPKYLKISDVFCRPSRSEGFGNSFIEAMASGLPVVATPVGGIVDFLFDADKNLRKEPTGFFAEVDDPADLAHRITRVLTDTGLTARIVSNAEKMVREKYDWNIIAKDMQEKVFNPLFK